MNPAQLLDHFDRISEAPDAIPRLRRFILDLAVRGKLVEQDPRDEPASELLKRIQQEKARLVKAGKIRESRPLEASDRAKAPYGIPTVWEWVPLGITVNSHLGGGTPSKNNSNYWDGDIFWASVKDVGKGKYIDETIDRITKAGLADSSSNLIPPGNLIIVTRMGLGKLSINRVPVAINQDLRALSLSSLAVIDYHFIFFKTYGFQGTGLTVKGIKVEELLTIAFPLPPVAEQHRIVAKVDELMALCDRLEAAQAEREKRRDRLAAASLQRLTQPADDVAVFQDQARFYFNHLPRLTTRPEQIQQLRQTILNLAVRGKLVRQDHNDEPAPVLYNRLRLALAKNHKAERTRARKNILLSTNGFFGDDTFPRSWVLTNFENVNTIVSGVAKGKNLRGLKTATYPYLRVANVQRGYLDLAVVKELEICADEFSRYQLRLGDVLMTEGGDWDKLGRAAIWKNEVPNCIHQNHIYRIRPANKEELLPEWIVLFANSPLGRFYFEGASKQTTNLASINMTQLRSCPLPLPPIAEQQRIVAKVDELMAPCDRLEAQLTTTQTESRRLLEAVLHEALAPSA